MTINLASPLSWRHTWPSWSGYAAAVWSLVYGGLGLCWTLGGSGFPFGAGDLTASPEMSLLYAVTPEVASPVIAVLGLVGAVAGVAMARGVGPRWAMLVFAWIAAIALALVIPDYRVMILLGYLPIFAIASPLGLLPMGFTDIVTWPRLNLAILVVGGLAWAIAALAYQRRTAGACGNCGRRAALAVRGGWTSPEAARRWGRWAVHIAAIVPEIYGLTRYAWALGIPLGIDSERLREGAEDGTWLMGAALAVLSTIGAILTIGLNRPWSEIWPRWIPGLRGKRVPPMFPVVFASVITVVVFSAGLMTWRVMLASPFDWSNWALAGPQMLWPFWSLALGAAALAYYLRTRTACRVCML